MSTTVIARTWLETGKAPRERSGEVAFGLVLLSGQVDATPDLVRSRALGEDVELALLTLAEERGDWPLVALFSQHAHTKAAAKAAKKAVFRAKQRGIDVPDAGAKRRAVALGPLPDPLPSYCTAFEPDGSFVVAFGGWSQVDGSWTLSGVVDLHDQLQAVFFSPHTSRSRIRTLLDRVVSDAAMMGEIPAPVASGLLRHAFDVSRAAGSVVEGDGIRAGQLLADATPMAALPLSGADMAGPIHAEALAQHPAVASWVRALQLGNPRLHGNAEHVDAAFTGESRPRWTRRLELVALLMHSSGEAKTANALAACCAALRQPTTAASTLPLLRALFRLD